VADPVPAGSDAFAGTYRCTSCGNSEYQTISGGDAAADPYPESS
jgi:hypothetical protein